PHVFRNVLHILILIAVEDGWGHDLLHWRQPRISPLSDGSDCNIAISNGSDEPVVVTDRKKADIEFSHLVRRFGDHSRRFDTLNISAHEFLYFHKPYLLHMALVKSSACLVPRYRWQPR